MHLNTASGNIPSIPAYVLLLFHKVLKIYAVNIKILDIECLIWLENFKRSEILQDSITNFWSKEALTVAAYVFLNMHDPKNCTKVPNMTYPEYWRKPELKSLHEQMPIYAWSKIINVGW